MSKFSGIAKLEIRTTGTADWSAPIVLDDVMEEGSENPVEIPEDDKTGRGDALYAGERRPFTFSSVNLNHFSTLRGYMVADTRVDLRMTDIEGNTEEIATGWIPKVWKPKLFATGRRQKFYLKVTPFII
jgi:hypothetical protein